MKTQLLKTDPAHPDPEVLAEAGRVLRAGGLVVFPTETVYGIAADAMNGASVEALRAAKGRPETKPLPVMVSGVEGLRAFSKEAMPEALKLASAFWPGPLTLVVPGGSQFGDVVHAGTGKVGLRAPDHVVAQGILSEAGRPLVLTSANLSGEPDTTTGAEALAALDGRVDLIVDAGATRLGQPSTVLDLTADPPRILRHGRIPEERLREHIVLAD